MPRAVHPLEAYISRESLLERPHHTAVAIDPQNPVEIDDAIQTHPLNNERTEHRVQVFIADAGLLLGQTALIDEARSIGWSQYNEADPKKSIPMLPEHVYKDTLGLDARVGEGVPAIEIAFDFSFVTRAIGNIDVRNKARIQVKKMSYDDHNNLLAKKDGSPDSVFAHERLGIARRLFQEPGGLNRIQGTRKSEDMVGFFMIAANRIMAQEMQRQGIPWLFRNHTGTAYLSWRDDRERRILERIKPGSYASRPITHEGLGIGSYCHFTSPLRRFPDLANHLNLHAHISGEEPPYDEREIDEIAQEMTALYIKRQTQHFKKAA